jgi:hypothetical protein
MIFFVKYCRRREKNVRGQNAFGVAQGASAVQTSVILVGRVGNIRITAVLVGATGDVSFGAVDLGGLLRGCLSDRSLHGALAHLRECKIGLQSIRSGLLERNHEIDTIVGVIGERR